MKAVERIRSVNRRATTESPVDGLMKAAEGRKVGQVFLPVRSG